MWRFHFLLIFTVTVCYALRNSHVNQVKTSHVRSHANGADPLTFERLAPEAHGRRLDQRSHFNASRDTSQWEIRYAKKKPVKKTPSCKNVKYCCGESCRVYPGRQYRCKKKHETTKFCTRKAKRTFLCRKKQPQKECIKKVTKPSKCTRNITFMKPCPLKTVTVPCTKKIVVKKTCKRLRRSAKCRKALKTPCKTKTTTRKYNCIKTKISTCRKKVKCRKKKMIKMKCVKSVRKRVEIQCPYSPSPSASSSASPSASSSVAPSASASSSASASATASPSASASASSSPSVTASSSPSLSMSASASASASASSTPSASLSRTPRPSASSSASPSTSTYIKPTPSMSNSPKASPVQSRTSSPSPSYSPYPASWGHAGSVSAPSVSSTPSMSSSVPTKPTASALACRCLNNGLDDMTAECKSAPSVCQLNSPLFDGNKCSMLCCEFCNKPSANHGRYGLVDFCAAHNDFVCSAEVFVMRKLKVQPVAENEDFTMKNNGENIPAVIRASGHKCYKTVEVNVPSVCIKKKTYTGSCITKTKCAKKFKSQCTEKVRKIVNSPCRGEAKAICRKKTVETYDCSYNKSVATRCPKVSTGMCKATKTAAYDCMKTATEKVPCRYGYLSKFFGSMTTCSKTVNEKYKCGSQVTYKWDTCTSPSTRKCRKKFCTRRVCK